MKIKTLISSIIMSSLCFTGSCMALPNVQLGGGEVGPGQTLKLSLNKLVRTVWYSVECDIVDVNNQENHATFSLNNEGTNSYGNVYVNGKNIGGGSYSIVTLDKVNNKLTISYLVTYGDSSLVVNNLEPVDKITITNCVAIAPRSK